MVEMLLPIARTSERLTSAKRTCRLTCSGVAVVSRAMTLVSSPRKACTRRSASDASSGLATVPVSSTVLLPIVATETFACGMASASIWSMLPMFDPTRMLAAQITSPAALLA